MAKAKSPEPEIPLTEPIEPTVLSTQERASQLRTATKQYREALERLIPAGNDTLLTAALAQAEAAAHTANRAING